MAVVGIALAVTAIVIYKYLRRSRARIKRQQVGGADALLETVTWHRGDTQGIAMGAPAGEDDHTPIGVEESCDRPGGHNPDNRAPQLAQDGTVPLFSNLEASPKTHT